MTAPRASAQASSLQTTTIHWAVNEESASHLLSAHSRTARERALSSLPPQQQEQQIFHDEDRFLSTSVFLLADKPEIVTNMILT